MLGLMMDEPLLIPSLIRHAAEFHGDTEVVARTGDGPLHRYDYARCHARVGRLAHALRRLGVGTGDRVATLAWNDHRHLELYYAVSGIGAICHTVNPRLFDDQLAYIVAHARDRAVFLDPDFVALAERLSGRWPSVERYVVLAEEANVPDTSLAGAVSYEALLEDVPGEAYPWPRLDERSASALCYTSGTTGNPKGVLYSHRSTVLHSFSICSANSAVPFSVRTTVLPVVPMFHVHAWGVPYAAPMAGAKLVLPGRRLDGESLLELIEGEAVTHALGVPTVWFGLLDHLQRSGRRLEGLRQLVVGGSAAPRSLIRAFQEEHGVEVNHAWGMTEMSPVGTTGQLKPKFDAATEDERYDLQESQGRIVYGVEAKVIGDDGEPLPRDGRAFGQLCVRGPWIASAYYEDEEASRSTFDADGWFRTGDVVTLDADGHMRIVDRSKDLIKSGGEWISSIDLENEAVGHPAIAEAAAIAKPDPKWGERPLLALVRRDGAEVEAEDIRAWLAERVARWWLPEEIVFLDELPHTATGKISKARLRDLLL